MNEILTKVLIGITLYTQGKMSLISRSRETSEEAVARRGAQDEAHARAPVRTQSPFAQRGRQGALQAKNPKADLEKAEVVAEKVVERLGAANRAFRHGDEHSGATALAAAKRDERILEGLTKGNVAGFTAPRSRSPTIVPEVHATAAGLEQCLALVRAKGRGKSGAKADPLLLCNIHLGEVCKHYTRKSDPRSLKITLSAAKTYAEGRHPKAADSTHRLDVSLGDTDYRMAVVNALSEWMASPVNQNPLFFGKKIGKMSSSAATKALLLKKLGSGRAARNRAVQGYSDSTAVSSLVAMIREAAADPAIQRNHPALSFVASKLNESDFRILSKDAGTWLLFKALIPFAQKGAPVQGKDGKMNEFIQYNLATAPALLQGFAPNEMLTRGQVGSLAK